MNNYEEPLSIGQWMLTLLIMAIPCVSFIMLFVWGFGSGNQSRANFCKACLIWWLIMIGMVVFIGIIAAPMSFALFNY